MRTFLVAAVAALVLAGQAGAWCKQPEPEPGPSPAPPVVVVPPAVPIYDYCGTGGPVVFAELVFGQPDTDPVWSGYTPAAYVEGLGTMCPWDVPDGYVDTGTRVDPAGVNYGGDEPGAIYEYWVRA